MTFRDTVNYVLQTMEIGQLDDDDQPELYEYQDKVPEHSPAEQLCFRAVERAVYWLVRRRRYSFDQELSNAGSTIFYETLRRELNKVSLPPAVSEAATHNIRTQASQMIEAAIKQHRHVIKLRQARIPIKPLIP